MDNTEQKMFIVGGFTGSKTFYKSIMEIDKNLNDSISQVPSFHFSLCTTEDALLLSGGNDFKENTSTSLVRKICLDEHSWTHLPDMPFPRYLHGSACVNQRLYTFGGRIKEKGQARKVSASVNVLDLKSSKWSECKPIPSPLSQPGIAVVDEFIFLIAGHTGNEWSSDVHKFDTQVGTWKSCQRIPKIGYFYRSTAVVTRDIFVLSGSLFMKYNVDEDEWTELTAPTKPSHVVSMVLYYNNCLVVTGGLVDMEKRDQPNDRVQVFDINKNKWGIEKYTLPLALRCHWTVAVDIANTKGTHGKTTTERPIQQLAKTSNASVTTTDTATFSTSEMDTKTMTSSANKPFGSPAAVVSNETKVPATPNAKLPRALSNVEFHSKSSTDPMKTNDKRVFVVGGFINKESDCNTDLEKYCNDHITDLSLVDFSLCMTDDALLVSGGIDCNTDNSTSLVQKFCLATHTWTTLSETPDPVSLHGSACVDNKLYTIGGYHLEKGEVKQFYASVNVLDLDTMKWSECKPMPLALREPGIAVIDGCIFVISGHTGSYYTEQLHKYNTRTGMWQRCKPITQSGRAYKSTAVLNMHIYVIIDSKCLRYNVHNDEWTELRPLLKQSYYCSMVVHMGHLVVTGRVNNPQKLEEPKNHVQVYNIVQDRWNIVHEKYKMLCKVFGQWTVDVNVAISNENLDHTPQLSPTRTPIVKAEGLLTTEKTDGSGIDTTARPAFRFLTKMPRRNKINPQVTDTVKQRSSISAQGKGLTPVTIDRSEERVLVVGGRQKMQTIYTHIIGLDKHPSDFLSNHQVADFSLCTTHDSLLLSGGTYITTGAYNSLTKVWKFCLTTRSWISLPDMPHAASLHGSACVNNKLYTIGGLYVENNIRKETYASVNVLDLQLLKWSECKSMQIAVSQPGIAVVDEFIFVIGGICGKELSSQVLRFDRKNSKWKRRERMPQTKDLYYATTVFNKHIYVLVGALLQYNVRRNVWTTLSSRPRKPSFGCSMVLHQGQLVVTGGYEENTNEPNDRVQIYDIDQKQWNIATYTMPLALCKHWTVSVNKAISE